MPIINQDMRLMDGKPLTAEKSTLIRFIAYGLIGLAIATGILTRLITLFRYTTFDIGPAPDQIRDAVVYMKMASGTIPTLGQASSVGDYSLPPLYYYLVFPTTWFGPNPSLHVIPNGICSVLAILLFMALIYELLEQVPSSKRLFLASLGGFWYSLIFAEVFISTFQWNVSPVPFFLFSFLLLYKRQLEGRASLPVQTLQWLLYGISLAILVSLHSTTLFVMPIVFVGSIIVFVIKHRKQPQHWGLPVVAIASALITLTPYWLGELDGGGSNTKQILALILNRTPTSDATAGLFERLSRMIFNYLELGQQVYFTRFPWSYRSLDLVFLSLVLILAMARFRGNRTLANALLTIWSLYLYAASNYTEDYIFHYKLLIFFAPILLTITTLAYLPEASNWLKRAIAGFLILGIGLSGLSNLSFNYQYLASRFGPQRAIAIPDVMAILNQLPDQSTICDPNYIRWRSQYHVVQYLDTYITHKNLRLSSTCQPGHYLIYPKFRYIFLDNNRWPHFQLVSTPPFDQQAVPVQNIPAAIVYQLQHHADLDPCYSFVAEPNHSCFSGSTPPHPSGI